MKVDELQELCGQGQDLLVAQKYIEAEQALVRAEHEALHRGDWDTLARLYMPLQEARRQRRQQTVQGPSCLNLISQGAGDHIEGRHVIENYPLGSLLVAGWGSIEPALQVRKFQARFKLLIDVFLAAVYPLIGGGHAIIIVPHDKGILPEVRPRRWQDFPRLMPHHSLILRESELPAGTSPPSPQRVAQIEQWWEKLHLPFLREARDTADPRKRIEAYRKVLRVDYACEFAHQELAATARELARTQLR